VLEQHPELKGVLLEWSSALDASSNARLSAEQLDTLYYEQDVLRSRTAALKSDQAALDRQVDLVLRGEGGFLTISEAMCDRRVEEKRGSDEREMLQDSRFVAIDESSDDDGDHDDEKDAVRASRTDTSSSSSSSRSKINLGLDSQIQSLSTDLAFLDHDINGLLSKLC
jgi:hypothetical protein